jgi:hypothetical protein
VFGGATTIIGGSGDGFEQSEAQSGKQEEAH